VATGHSRQHDGGVKRREPSLLAARTATTKIRRAQVDLVANMALLPPTRRSGDDHVHIRAVDQLVAAEHRK
jgi:hypothetical protein